VAFLDVMHFLRAIPSPMHPRQPTQARHDGQRPRIRLVILRQVARCDSIWHLPRRQYHKKLGGTAYPLSSAYDPYVHGTRTGQASFGCIHIPTGQYRDFNQAMKTHKPTSIQIYPAGKAPSTQAPNVASNQSKPGATGPQSKPVASNEAKKDEPKK
jgi:hypothetical protein